MKQSKVQSYGLLITSMLIFGSVGIFRRMVPLSSAFIALVRGLVGGGCLFLVSRIQHRKNAKIGTKTVFLLALIGGLIGFNWVFLFEAYRYTTVATATLCYYMQPTIVILISPLVFREPVSLKKMLCAAVSLVGMVMVSGVLSGGEVMAENGKGIAFGLAAAALYAAIVLLNQTVRSVDTVRQTEIELFCSALVVLPYWLLTDRAPLGSLADGKTVLLLAVMGVVHTGLGYALYFGSMKGLPTQSVAVLSYLDPVTALLLSALVLREPITLLGLVGAALIIGAALVSEIRFKKNKKESQV